MAPHKGQGHPKGKQTAPKEKKKPQDVDPPSSDEEDCSVDQQAILDQLADMEQACGISPGGPLPVPASGRKTRKSVQRRFTAQVRNRLSLLHAQKQAYGVLVHGDSGMSEAVGNGEQDRAMAVHGHPSQVFPYPSCSRPVLGCILHLKIQTQCGYGATAVRFLLH